MGFLITGIIRFVFFPFSPIILMVSRHPNYYTKISLCFVSSPVKMIGDIVRSENEWQDIVSVPSISFPNWGRILSTCSFGRTKSPPQKIVDSNCGRCDGGGWNLFKTFLPFIMEVWKADKVIIISWLDADWRQIRGWGGTHPENLTQSKKRVLNF